MKIVILCSTNASVLKRYFYDFDDSVDFSIYSDRKCGAIDFAKEASIDFNVYEAKSGLEFSDFLAKEFEGDETTIFFSFYTKLFKGRFIKEHAGRIINFHPSILPACPGQDGFGDTIKSGSRFVGSTVHLVDEGMDTGTPLIQAAFPRDPKMSIPDLRHRVFLQQVVSLAQVIQWFLDGRVEYTDNTLYVHESKFLVSEFSPNLDEHYQEYFSRATECH
ncbi:formyltransferase family protein [Marinobacterium sp. BA1]|uniref:formyltransferase family protein n=1 Tax=Marinobacterium sp. BA1 TaxID=3138931 RepID=UPI0032E55A77